jgi:hypothetical protein
LNGTVRQLISVCVAAVATLVFAAGLAGSASGGSADYVDVGNGNYVAGYAFWTARPSFAN